MPIADSYRVTEGVLEGEDNIGIAAVHTVCDCVV